MKNNSTLHQFFEENLPDFHNKAAKFLDEPISNTFCDQYFAEALKRHDAKIVAPYADAAIAAVMMKELSSVPSVCSIRLIMA